MILCLDGAEGSGKTVLSELLYQYVKSLYPTVEIYHIPQELCLYTMATCYNAAAFTIDEFEEVKRKHTPPFKENVCYILDTSVLSFIMHGYDIERVAKLSVEGLYPTVILHSKRLREEYQPNDSEKISTIDEQNKTKDNYIKFAERNNLPIVCTDNAKGICLNKILNVPIVKQFVQACETGQTIGSGKFIDLNEH